MKPMGYRTITGITAALSLAAACFLAWPAPCASAAETADAVRESGEMIVGVRAGYLPFSEATGQGDEIVCSGFDVDLARAIAELIGVRARFVVVEADVTIPMAAEGIIHMAPGINHRMSWERVIDFSVTYLHGGTMAMVPASSGIRSLSSLRGKRIAAVAGTDVAGIEEKIAGCTVTRADTPEAGLELLANREVVALVGDFKDLVNLITECEKPAALRIIGPPVIPTPIAMGLPPDDGTWREMVDRALMDLWVSGRFAEIYEAWFGKGASVRLPLAFTMEVWPK